MRILPLTLALLLALIAPLQAQMPVQDTIPQLKEWWRADDMQYGKYGMTWLDNFYQGKGALVVWTPQGVKTWLLRFPGDTMNVFTWEKGSANIKTGDFNGDGATDYIDENGNIYQGIKNGQPPKAEVQTPVSNFRPTVITDINGDGFEDMLTPGSVVFGKPVLSELQHEKLNFPEIDSNNSPLSSYMVSPKEMRVICRHFYWTNLTDFPFQRVYKEGLRLVRIWWNGNGFSSEKLDEFTVDTKDSTGIHWDGGILSLGQGKHFYISATLISGKYERTNVTMYELSNDKIEKKFNTRIDSISVLKVFSRSIDNDAILDWCIAHFPNDDGYSNVVFYSGAITNSLQPIGKYVTCQEPFIISFPINNEISPQNGLIYCANHGWCFQGIKLPKSTGVKQEENHLYSPLSIEVISPQPISKKGTLTIQLSDFLLTNNELSLYSYNGSKLLTFRTVQLFDKSKVLSIPLSDYNLSEGVYWLSLTTGGEQISTKLIIN